MGMQISRRAFVGTGAAAIGALGVSATAAEAQLVYQHNDWKFAEFDALLKQRARVKQLFDIHAIADGGFLNAIKNSLNGLHFGFGIPADQIKIVVATHGPANVLNFDNSMWAKYRLGEFLKINDPKTGKPTTRNPYFAKSPATSTDPEDRASIFQDTSVEALQGRGVKFLSCHNSTQAVARELVEQNSLKQSADEITQDLQTHTVPSVLIVPAMVAAITLLQSEGRYTYISS
jgi:intracellular sulfur oxidation DsrE/DsrF family protein